MESASPPPTSGASAPERDDANLWSELLQAARGGDPAAASELIQTWRTYLLHLVESEMPPELRQKIGVSDVVQSACLDIHLRLADFRGQSVEQWRAWLKRLIINDLQDARRRFVDARRRDVRRERPLPAPDAPDGQVTDSRPSPRATLIAQEETEALRAALLRLPEDYRLILRLRNWECLPLAEIGRRMNRSEEAVRKLWSRAILRLQQELSNRERESAR